MPLDENKYINFQKEYEAEKITGL